MTGKISNKALLLHILEAINDIENFVGGLGISEFMNNKLIKSAVVRQLEIIGEASNHLTDDITDKYKEIIWHEIASFRNIVVYEYFIVDYGVVWNIITDHLQPLKITVNKKF